MSASNGRDNHRHDPVRPLVDVQEGTIDRSIFLDQGIFEREMEHLFARAWLFVGHESQVPNPGDFFTSRMGLDSVLLTRDNGGNIQVLLNSCRHRGMKVCRYDQGNTMEFMCPYHGWSYSTDGSLVSTPGELYGVPHYQTYGGKLDKAKWGLIRVAQQVNYHGLIFATWDPEAPAFENYVGGFHPWLSKLTESMDGRPDGTEVFEGVLKWRVPANWKFVAENFLGDAYHTYTTHSSVEAVGIGPGGKTARRTGAARAGAMGVSTSLTRLGHGSNGGVHDVRPYPEFEEPELSEYFRAAWNSRVARYADQGRSLGATSPSTLFPSMSFHPGFPRTVVVAHPCGPRETEMWRWFLVDKDAPDFVRDWLRHYYLRYSGPAGMTEQDDMENWGYATEASAGYIARRYPYNYQQGFGLTKPSDLEGAVESLKYPSEENARNFYRRWAELVDGLSWPELMAGA